MSAKQWNNVRQPGILKRAPVLVSLFLCLWSLVLLKNSFSSSGAVCSRQASRLGSVSTDQNDRRTLQQGSLSAASESTGSSKNAPSLSMTIFCSPKSYNLESPESDEQRRALLSWLRLNPRPKVVLLGDDPTFPEVAKEFPDSVFVEPNLDYNFRGIPQFHSMVARAQAADTDLSMLINGDIILLNDIMLAVDRVSSNFDNWVLTAARWDLGSVFPFDLKSPNEVSDPNQEAALDAEIKEFVQTNGSLHTYGGVDFWLWNNSPVPLFADAMPPFTFGRSKYDNWLTHEVIAGGLREVVDASLAVTNAHVAHAYNHVATLTNGTKGSVAVGKNFWSEKKKSSWEMFNNIHLAESHGTYTNQLGTALHAPWKLSSCFEPLVHNICLQKRQRPANCSCEYSSYARSTQSDPQLADSTWTCGKVSVDRKTEFSIQAVPTETSKEGLPHTMEQLLKATALEIKGQRVVVLVAVTYGYREMLMNFVCRLRSLGLAGSLVVAALDEEMYRFGFNQGLAVFYERASDDLKSMESKDCAFGSQCFRQFTKLKSRAVLRVLKAGYCVLWSDVDIVWYRDPLPHLMSYGPNSLPIQSNEPDEKLVGTGIRRINSGFYFAWANRKTVAAFEEIVDHARHTTLSEQPSFYDVLCGTKGERVVRRKEQCKWKNGLVVVFLDRAKYPNGAIFGLWDKSNVTEGCRKCSILHNNWISGKDAKKDRLVRNGYWQYDVERRMCMYEWHSRLSNIYRPAKLRAKGGNKEASS